MSTSLTSLTYLHPADLGFGVLIFLGVILLLGCVAFAVILAYILKYFLHRKQQNIDAGEQRYERKI